MGQTLQLRAAAKCRKPAAIWILTSILLLTHVVPQTASWLEVSENAAQGTGSWVQRAASTSHLYHKESEHLPLTRPNAKHFHDAYYPVLSHTAGCRVNMHHEGDLVEPALLAGDANITTNSTKWPQPAVCSDALCLVQAILAKEPQILVQHDIDVSESLPLPDVTTKITILGTCLDGPCVIDGKGAGQIFIVGISGVLTLRSLEITGGYCSEGSAVLVSGNINGMGGRLLALNVLFYNNTVSGSGGAVMVKAGALAHIRSCVFEQNMASRGAALFVGSAEEYPMPAAVGETCGLTTCVTVINTAFWRNTANWGGAVYVDDAPPSARVVVGQNLSAQPAVLLTTVPWLGHVDGGAILLAYLSSGAIGHVKMTSFINNTARMSGGDVELQPGHGRTHGVLFNAYMTQFSGSSLMGGHAVAVKRFANATFTRCHELNDWAIFCGGRTCDFCPSKEAQYSMAPSNDLFLLNPMNDTTCPRPPPPLCDWIPPECALPPPPPPSPPPPSPPPPSPPPPSPSPPPPSPPPPSPPPPSPPPPSPPPPSPPPPSPPPPSPPPPSPPPPSPPPPSPPPPSPPPPSPPPPSPPPPSPPPPSPPPPSPPPPSPPPPSPPPPSPPPPSPPPPTPPPHSPPPPSPPPPSPPPPSPPPPPPPKKKHHHHPPHHPPPSPPPPSPPPPSPPPPSPPPPSPPPPSPPPPSPPPPSPPPSPPPPVPTPAPAPMVIPPPPPVFKKGSPPPPTFFAESAPPAPPPPPILTPAPAPTPMCNCTCPSSPSKHPNKGVIEGDPHFFGKHGEQFDFHAKDNRDYCVISDTKLQINMHTFHGLHKTDSFISMIGVLYKDYKILINVQPYHNRNQSMQQNLVQINNVELPKAHKYKSSNNGLLIDHYQNFIHVHILDVIDFNVTIIKPTFGIHGSGKSYINFQMSEIKVSPIIHGILGQTFQETKEVYLKLHRAHGMTPKEAAKIFMDGSEDDYLTSGIFAADCRFAEFEGQKKLPIKVKRALISKAKGLFSTQEDEEIVSGCAGIGDPTAVCINFIDDWINRTQLP